MGDGQETGWGDRIAAYKKDQAAEAKLRECIWRDWQRSRVHFLEYMGHPTREAKKIADDEMGRIRLKT